jgi:hypothetical protein
MRRSNGTLLRGGVLGYPSVAYRRRSIDAYIIARVADLKNENIIPNPQQIISSISHPKVHANGVSKPPPCQVCKAGQSAYYVFAFLSSSHVTIRCY